MKIIHLLIVFLLVHTSQGQGGKGSEKGKGGPEKAGGKGPAHGKASPSKPTDNKKWLTLNGAEPVVAARGGFSGIFPQGSEVGFMMGAHPQSTLPSTLVFCDLQMSSDGMGVCLSDIVMTSVTNVADLFPNEQKTYNISGQEVKGWFTLDYSFEILSTKLSLIQNVQNRPGFMDALFHLESPSNLVRVQPPYNVWINVENYKFYTEHKIDPVDYVEKDLLKKNPPQIISSDEIGFLRDLGKKMNKNVNTKLIFKVHKQLDLLEATTNEPYGSLLQNMSNIKTFASGILVPKDFIWPMNETRYLQQRTNLVTDAHKEGLEVYAFGFANDLPLSFNYSYDPTKEYLQFIDNSEFSVDGVLTDFPSTASESIACLSQNKNATRLLKNLVISHNGASGDYPPSTDLAYQKAIDDGVDVIDCNVQMTKDGIAFCMSSPDLAGPTSAGEIFPDKASVVPEIQPSGGIFSFELAWNEIQSLKPRLKSPYEKELGRNPANKFKGKFVTLPDFLEIAKKTKDVGVLLNISKAAFLAEKGLDIVETVTTALTEAGLDKEAKRKVMIMSDDSSVLEEFKQVQTYTRVFSINRDFSGVTPGVPMEIKKFADAVSMQKSAIIRSYDKPFYLTKSFTDIVPAMHSANISVYVAPLRNEFLAFLFDLNADPYTELATLIAAEVDGFFTEYPATAIAYMSSPCVDPNQNHSYRIRPVKPGDMYGHLQLPAPAPSPDMPTPPGLIIDVQDVIHPPLPPVSKGGASGAQNGSNTAPPAAGAPAPSAASDTLTASNAGLFISAIVAIFALLNVL